MSWSFSALGKPENVAVALEKHSETMTGQSRSEFDDAKPHLIALVKENFAKPGRGYIEPMIKIDASGSGSAAQGEQLNRNVTVKIEPWYGIIV